jgi:CRP-like cAMP-binding protein
VNHDIILTAIGKYISLLPDEQDFLLASLVPQHIRQGEFLEHAGDPAKYLTYVNSGCLMTYFTDANGHDHVLQFATTGWWTGDLTCYVKNIPNIYSTKALADSDVLLLPKVGMDTLLEKFPKFERYFRIIFQNSLITHQERILQGFSATADERYQHFLDKYPTLEQYVPQKYIASYLGITPEFLSKIRRKLMEK